MATLKSKLKKIEDNIMDGLDFIILDLNNDLKIRLFGGVQPLCHNGTCPSPDSTDDNNMCTNDVCTGTDTFKNNTCTNKKCI